MERIASFTVDHNKLVPGLYYSRRDGDIVTFDLRFKKPNTGDLLTNAQMHSAEHLIATLLRNSQDKEAVIYFGPMGCRTGFYFLLRNVEKARAVEFIKEIFRSIASFEGEIPGTRPEECGNYREHDLAGALEWVKNFLPVIEPWNEEKLAYQA